MFKILSVIVAMLASPAAPASHPANAAAAINPPDLPAAERSAPPPAQAKIEGPLLITSNKDGMVRLDEDAASVVVNNPDRISIKIETPRLLIIVPHQPGATSFTVLGADGGTILQKDVIVSNVQPDYVRIHRMCSGNDSGCVANAYYYCPNGCYEVTPVAGGSGGATVAPMPTAGGP